MSIHTNQLANFVDVSTLSMHMTFIGYCAGNVYKGGLCPSDNS